MTDCRESLYDISIVVISIASPEHAFNEIPGKHLDFPRAFPPPSQLISRNHWVFFVFLQHILREDIRPLLPMAFVASSSFIVGLPRPSSITSLLNMARRVYMEWPGGM